MQQASPTKPEVDAVTTSVCFAVAALHSVGVAHCDLKPAQFCFRSRGPGLQVKLVDLDMAVNFRAAPMPLRGLTPAFAPLEALQDPPPMAGPEVDVGALGLILVQLRHPYRKQVLATDAAARNLAGRAQAIEQALASLSAEEGTLLRRLLSDSPSARPTMPEVLRDPLVSAGKDSLVRSVKAAEAKADQVDQLQGQLQDLQEGLGLLGDVVKGEAQSAAEGLKKAMEAGNSELHEALSQPHGR